MDANKAAMVDVIRRHLYLNQETAWSAITSTKGTKYDYENAVRMDFLSTSQHYQACHNAALQAVAMIEQELAQEHGKVGEYWSKRAAY